MHRQIIFLLALNLSILLANSGYISGNVYGENSEPLPGCNVYLDGYEIGTATDMDGFFKIENLDEGKYTLLVDFLGYKQGSFTFYISEYEDDLNEENNNSDDYLSKLNLEDNENQNSVEKQPYFEYISIFLNSVALDLDEIIISASKVKQKITESPSIISLINERNIRRQVGVSDYNRLAAMAKGVDVTYYGAQGAQINARGFDGAYSTRFRQFNDGLYMGEAVTGQVYSLISGPPKESISRIEVLFGPQSALYGPDASQGLLNIIRKHPMQDAMNEINFSTSSLNNPRIGGRFVKNYNKISIDISAESQYTNEIPYGNDEKEIFWVLGDTLYLTEDLFDPIELRKNHVSSNFYYRIDDKNELSAFYDYTEGSGYAIGSLGPLYIKNLTNHQYGVRLINDHHSLRVSSRNQRADAASRTSIGVHQVDNRTLNGVTMTWAEALEAFDEDSLNFWFQNSSSMSWNEALKSFGEDSNNWWLKYNSDEFIIDYQYNNKISDRLKVVSGLDYEFKFPKTERTAINDIGISPITNLSGGTKVNEYRYGVYGQLDYFLDNDYSVNFSLRFDDHEYYGKTFSPRASLVKKNFMSGTVKFIAGTGFKAPTLFERNIYSGQKAIAGGTEGSLDPILGIPYPEDFIINGVAMGSATGFTQVDFKDLNGNGVYDGSDIDSLISSRYTAPLELEEHQSMELAYTGVINGNNLVEINFYRGHYKNFKGPLTAFAVTGPAWNYFTQAFAPLQLDGIRQVNYGEELVVDNPIPAFTYALTYANLPLDVVFYGLEGGWKHLRENYEISMNFSVFNDQSLVDKREKGEKYYNYTIGAESSQLSDSAYVDYLSYARIYSNTPNLKGSFSITNHNGFIDKLSSTITLKMTSPFDFVSGYFEANEEGKGTIPASTAGQSWFRNPGQIGGQLYGDIDITYEHNDQTYLGFAVKNIFQTEAPTIPITPQIPRSYSFEIGYRF